MIRMKDSIVTKKMELHVDDYADETSESSTGDEGSDSTPNDTKSRRSAKRRIIDETLLDDDEARKLESRRAYNRKCAAKARKRSKDLISQLQEEVHQLNEEKTRLERNTEVMFAQLKVLEQQNQTLLLNQRQRYVLPAMTNNRTSLLGGIPQVNLFGGQGGGTGISAASLLGSLSQRDRLIASQILSNEFQRQNSAGSR